MLKGILFYKLENLTSKVIGPMFRRTGQSLFWLGSSLQGPMDNNDRLVPSLRCIPISDAKYPKLLDVFLSIIYKQFNRLIGLHQMLQ